MKAPAAKVRRNPVKGARRGQAAKDPKGAKQAKAPHDFTSAVYSVVRRCPRGKIVSYGGVAALLGHPRAARGVGHALSVLPDGTDVPWWRVVNRNGEISIRSAYYAPSIQRALLEAEGVVFNASGRISWKRFGWDGAGVEGAWEMGGRSDRGKRSSAAPATRRARK